MKIKIFFKYLIYIGLPLGAYTGYRYGGEYGFLEGVKFGSFTGISVGTLFSIIALIRNFFELLTSGPDLLRH